MTAPAPTLESVLEAGLPTETVGQRKSAAWINSVSARTPKFFMLKDIPDNSDRFAESLVAAKQQASKFMDAQLGHPAPEWVTIPQ